MHRGTCALLSTCDALELFGKSQVGDVVALLSGLLLHTFPQWSLPCILSVVRSDFVRLSMP